jgi:DNA-binding transcriptional LysR family regulator
MFFARGSSTLLARSFARRAKSTSAGAEEAVASGGSIVGAVATTFGTYCLADFLSNFIQHPTQKVSYTFDVSFEV